MSGALGRIRTPDPLVRSQVLYPTELPALCEVVFLVRCRIRKSRNFTDFAQALPVLSWLISYLFRYSRRPWQPAWQYNSYGMVSLETATSVAQGVANFVDWYRDYYKV